MIEKPVQGLIGTPIEMENGANPLRAVYYAARLLELPKPTVYNATDD